MTKRLFLEVITPQGVAVREEVDSVVAPGIEGYLEVLPEHTTFLSALQVGELSYVKDGYERSLQVGGGVLEVLEDRVLVLVESARPI
ncbi:MAG TPA: hypothetical protein EYP17_10005 [Candidatus Latescibacteria bacterium]|nr:hypothetical protein [Candidatus Latescibacterota bacterium]